MILSVVFPIPFVAAAVSIARNRTSTRLEKAVWVLSYPRCQRVRHRAVVAWVWSVGASCFTMPHDETGTMGDRRDSPQRLHPRRAIVPALCVVVGVVMMLRGAVGLGGNGDPLYLLLDRPRGGRIIAFFLSRRPANRGR